MENRPLNGDYDQVNWNEINKLLNPQLNIDLSSVFILLNKHCSCGVLSEISSTDRSMFFWIIHEMKLCLCHDTLQDDWTKNKVWEKIWKTHFFWTKRTKNNEDLLIQIWCDLEPLKWKSSHLGPNLATLNKKESFKSLRMLKTWMNKCKKPKFAKEAMLLKNNLAI